jgi:predicted dehydrogenase
MTTYAVVGAGWRSEFYIRLGHLLPERFQLTGVVVRNPERAVEIHSDFGVATFESVTALLQFSKPDFVVIAVSWASNPALVSEFVALGIPVLCETPPAPDAQRLRDLWRSVGKSELVQVAEQYMYLPAHAARRTAVQAGEIGSATSVEISSTHGYHAVSMMREFLEAGFESTSVDAHSFSAPLIDPLSRDGWNVDQSAKMRRTTIATIDFRNGKSGIYNFVENQWHNQLRHRRIVIRGSAGEIVDNQMIALVKGPTIVESEFRRYQLGYDLNLDGFDTEHISLNGKVLYRNPFVGLRLMDEEIAIGTLMVKMADWIEETGVAPYPLWEAAQDQLISLAIEESVLTGKMVQTSREIWAR